MSQKDSIEELFKSKLENFESPVNDSMWSNISSNIGINAAGSTTSSVFSSLFSTTGIAVSTGLICTVATVLIMSLGNKKTTFTEAKETTTQIPEQTHTEIQTIIPEILNDDEIAVNNIVRHSATEKNDPSVKKEVKETFKVEVTNTKEEAYIKPLSAANSFLTPPSKLNAEQRAKEKNAIAKEQAETTNEITITKTKEDELVATIIASPVGGYAPLDVYFSNAATRGTVHWDFGDGSVSDETSPSHTFEKFGTYTVELLITDKDGNEHKDYRVIKVSSNSSLTEFPNVFTPNGDGINDLCTVKGKNLDLFQMKVFNRSGEVIFASESLDHAWDGKNKFGENIPTGTYFYLITARGIDGKVYEHTGTITLSR